MGKNIKFPIKVSNSHRQFIREETKVTNKNGGGGENVSTQAQEMKKEKYKTDCRLDFGFQSRWGNSDRIDPHA